MCFSNSCDLYVLAYSLNRKTVVYRINVGKDTSIEMQEGLGRQSSLAHEVSQTLEQLQRPGGLEYMSSQHLSHNDTFKGEIAKSVFEGFRW